MKKQDYFKNLIKRNRKKLLECGFKPSTISMYISGDRMPRRKMAVDIALALDVPLEKIPQRKLQWGIK
jgi:hypothetical protein